MEDALREAGLHTRRLTLPGHGDEPSRRFHETSALEILDHCAQEYQSFADTVDDVYLVGHSLGGVCALLTAAIRPPGLKGLIAFSTPYEHAYFYNYLQGLVRLPFPHLIRGVYFAPKDRSTFIRPDCKPWNLPRLLEQSRVIFSLLKEQVPNINVPVSLAHSLYDLTIPYAEMEKLADIIGQSAPVRTTTLHRSGHRIFPSSQDLDEALQVIFTFLEAEGAYGGNGTARFVHHPAGGSHTKVDELK